MDYFSQNFSRALTLSIVSLLLVPLLATADVIKQYDVELTINREGTLDVREEIQYDFGSREARGITRVLDKTRVQGGDLHIRNIAVTRNGLEEKKKITRERYNTSIRIGNSDSFVKGTQRYLITYTVPNAFIYAEQRDELYWNVIENDWGGVTIENWSVVINGGSAIPLIQSSCFVGQELETNPCAVSGADFSSTEPLPEGGGVTISHVVEPGYLGKPVVINYRTVGKLGALAGALYLFLYFPITHYRRRWGITSHRKPIINQFDSFKDYRPLMTASLFLKKDVPHVGITATLVDFARMGIISIERKQVKKETEYTLRLVSEDVEHVDKIDTLVLKMMFGETLKVGDTYIVGKDQFSNRWYSQLDTVLRRKRNDDGFIEQHKGRAPYRNFFVALSILFVGLITAFGFRILFLACVLLVAPVIWVAVLHVMYWPSEKYKDLVEHMKGLKRYIKVAEKDRLDFHANEETPMIMELMPYAMILGVAETFARMHENLEVDGLSINELHEFQKDASGLISASILRTTERTSSGGGTQTSRRNRTQRFKSSSRRSSRSGSGGGGGRRW